MPFNKVVTIAAGLIAILGIFIAVLIVMFGLVHARFFAVDKEQVTKSLSPSLIQPLPKIDSLPPDLRTSLAQIYIQQNVLEVTAQANRILDGIDGFEHLSVENIEEGGGILEWIGGYDFDRESQTLINRLNLSVLEEIGSDTTILSASLPFYVKIHPQEGAIDHGWMSDRTESLVEIECGLADLEPDAPVFTRSDLQTSLSRDVWETCSEVRASVLVHWNDIEAAVIKGLQDQYRVEARRLDRIVGVPFEQHIADNLNLRRLARTPLVHEEEAYVYLESTLRFGPDQVSETVDVDFVLVATIMENLEFLHGSIAMLDARFRFPFETTLSKR